ncbi:MAG: hypothetical protein R2711_06535 [Acidimicrobiales bacterium]
MIPLAEAREHVLARCSPRGPVPVALADAQGCVLAGPVVAPEAVPPWANSAMDGYAVRAADVAGAADAAPIALAVVDTVHAGAAAAVEVGPGQAVRIMTGAPVPPGADAVVMVERTRGGPDAAVVEVLDAVEAGRNVRAAGSDIAAGTVVLAAGTVLGPAHLGVLASVGVRRPVVIPAPGSASSPPATSSSTTTGRSARGRSARATAPRSWRWPARSASTRSTSARSPTTPTRSRPPWWRSGHLRRHRHERRREHGRRRPGEGRARPHRRGAVDAGGHPAGEALRVRRARRHADLRAARQPGLVDGVAEPARGPRAAAAGRPPTSTCRRWRRSPVPTSGAGPTAAPPTSGPWPAGTRDAWSPHP